MIKLFSDERGISLIMTIIASLFLSILGYVTISTVVTDSRLGARSLNSSQAFWLAESGLELTYRWLQFQDPPPGGTAAFLHYNQHPEGGGTFTVTVDPDNGNPGTYLKKYKISSVGKVDQTVRKLEIEMQTTTFNKFGYLTGDEGGTIWFNTGDLLEGPIHSNDQISIVGSPVFMGKVTSTASSFNQGSPFNPDFQAGYQLGVPPVIFPTEQDVLDNYWSENTEPPPLIIDARFGRKADIQFIANGTLKYNVWHWEGAVKVWDILNQIEDLDDLNGFIQVLGPVKVKGVVNDAVTVFATKKIKITNNIVYAMSDANGKPLPGCDDYLGLIAKTDVLILENAANNNDVIINAAILTLGDSFTVQNYASGPPRGDLTIYGSLSQKVRGPVGTFGWWGTTGYQKDYHYDDRFVDTPPPYYPSVGKYHYLYWKEITD
ncbi:DUF4900 domain-containing protein [candidate division KSB1 bacterium]|nr:DUF4900 domain-containing protein [candidate division KSB1 bacterium]